MIVKDDFWSAPTKPDEQAERTMTVTHSDTVGTVSGGWKIRHSLWLLAPVLGFGYLSFVGFVFCAMRIQTRKWVVLATISVALTVLGWILLASWTDASGAGTTAARVYLVELWLASIAFGLVVNRDYLRWRSIRGVRGSVGSIRDGTVVYKLNPSPSDHYEPVGYGVPGRPETGGTERFIAPGWYGDPHSDQRLRWWNGYIWTAETVPRPR